MTSVSYPNSAENISYAYDLSQSCGISVGQLCQINDESGQTNYVYDAWGNVLEHQKQELSRTYLTTYAYDAEDRIIQMTYPNGRVVNYQRDVIGRVIGVTTEVGSNVSNVVTNQIYRADNALTGATLGNALQESRRYDLQSRTTQIQLGALESSSYSYDANGNIIELGKPVEGRVYDYDALDRLILDNKALVSDLVNNYSYEYDENGNRTRRSGRNYQYAPNSNLLTRDGGLNINRDAVGNTLNYSGGRSFTYSDSNRLRTVTRSGTLRATYRYNAMNQRTRKEFPNSSNQVFHYDLAGNLIMRTLQNSRPLEDYIWVDGVLRQFTTLRGRNNGTIREERVKTFITTDHLGTPRLGTNDSQTIAWRWDSDAFNIRRPLNDPDGDGTQVNLLIGFPGQYYDGESGLFYNWNRYYDRLSGRYVTSDPIGLSGGLNTYGYVGGNPLSRLDKEGLQFDGFRFLGGFSDFEFLEFKVREETSNNGVTPEGLGQFALQCGLCSLECFVTAPLQAAVRGSVDKVLKQSLGRAFLFEDIYCVVKCAQ